VAKRKNKIYKQDPTIFLVVIGILAFLLISSLFTFKYTLFQKLYPKPLSHAAQTKYVMITNNTFQQSETVNVGDTVSWMNMDAVPHNVTSQTGLFDSGLINQNQIWSFTFNTPGTYNYACSVHPEMTGTIIVLGTATASPTQSPQPTSIPTNTPQQTNTPTNQQTSTQTTQTNNTTTSTATPAPIRLATATPKPKTVTKSAASTPISSASNTPSSTPFHRDYESTPAPSISPKPKSFIQPVFDFFNSTFTAFFSLFIGKK